jgi:GDP-L-fucose synthase
VDSPEPVNIGTGRETQIADLAELVRRLSGFEGAVVWDSSKPDGQVSRRLDVSRARSLVGFEAGVSLEAGLAATIEAFRSDHLAASAR